MWSCEAMWQTENVVFHLTWIHVYKSWNKYGSPPTMITWHSIRVTSTKIYMSVFTWFMTTSTHTMLIARKDDDLFYWVTMCKLAWFFDHVIIWSLLTNIKRVTSNPQGLYTLNVTGAVAYDTGSKLKNHITLS